MGEIAPNGRSDLRDLLGGAKPVKPRHQRGVQACRDGQSRGRNGGGCPSHFVVAFSFQDRFSHFLNKQRNSICSFDDISLNSLWKHVVACYTLNHRADFTLSEPVKAEGGDVGSSKPGRFEFRAVRDD